MKNTPSKASHFSALAILLLAAFSSIEPGCATSSDDGFAAARVVQTRADLVGGDRALGEIGDFLLENDKIRVVIQRPGFSRGFGVYGGSLIDADLRRTSSQGSSAAGVGYDAFGELFPAFFVEACAVDTVTIPSDGTSGGAARVQASGKAGDFLELLAILNRIVTGSNIDSQNPKSGARIKYTTTYELLPKKNYVTIRFKVQSLVEDTLFFPSKEALQLLGSLNVAVDGFTVPVGDVALYGATSDVFIPGIGFDLRFGLEDAYARKIPFPAFPGFAAEFIASRGDHASYGIVAEPSDHNYVNNRRDVYDDGKTPITNSSILVPFVATSFVGLFYDEAPASIPPLGSFEIVKHFIVGSGDVGSIVDTVNDMRGASVGTLAGQVLDSTTGTPSIGTSVVVYQRSGKDERRIYSQYDVRDGGDFRGTLTPGAYSLRVTGDGRPITRYVDFDIRAGETQSLRVESDPPGRVVVHVADEEGGGLPAKATAVGRYDARFSNQLTRTFLYDLQAGESLRSSDVVDDDPADPETRKFIETNAFGANGEIEMRVRPGTYDIVSSRGPEYDTSTTRVNVAAGQTATVAHVLHRVVATPGWIAADTHIHSRNSIDSPMTLDQRVAGLAAEGLEWVVSTDHNYVTDYAPYIARNDLESWLFPSVGVEMTTLESGHFNGYPLRYDVGPVTHGAFEWADRTPDQIFDSLRDLGRNGPAQTIIQVNHPRDKILGYFSQYTRHPLTAEEIPPTPLGKIAAPAGPAFRDDAGKTQFSLKYDAMELTNGKLYWEIHHYRVPESLSPYGTLPATIPPTGTILKDSTGQVAFPGVVDDWFNLLNLGYRFVGVGSGDSHEATDEAGQFRTMVYVGDDRPSTLTDDRVVDSLRSRHVVATNGPLLDFFIDDPVRGVMGQTLDTANDKVSLTYTLTSASWAPVGRINIYANGTIAQSYTIDEHANLAVAPQKQVVQLDLARDASNSPIDTWFVVEAIGTTSMFPIIRPLEVPPVVLTDAVASLAGPLGITSDDFGALRPPQVFPITAYAITNPVWVTRGKHAFQAPGVVPPEIQDLPQNDPHFQNGVYARGTVSARVADLRVTPKDDRIRAALGKPHLFDPRPELPFDVRKALLRFGHAGHGH